MGNPFKFGTVVEEPYFTNRSDEIRFVKSVLSSANNLVLISPRRYGKTSLVLRVLNELNRPFLMLDLQVIISADDLAGQLLKKLFRIYPFEKVKHYLKGFKVVPSVNINPVTNEVDVSFSPNSVAFTSLDDVLGLIGDITKQKNKPVIVFDEFQEITRIGKDLDKRLRSSMQFHKNVNYVFLGSQESLIRDIFEKKKSPFYHFGQLMNLERIPFDEFENYLVSGLKSVLKNPAIVSKEILEVTKCHPYYTQMLAFTIWELLAEKKESSKVVKDAIDYIIRIHDVDYERLWRTLNRTEMKVLIGLVKSENLPMSEAFLKDSGAGATSTVFSSLQSLIKKGFLVKRSEDYVFDDAFFGLWILKRRG
jgi:AAA+ ATPase superfamily predicted ATPase